MREFCRSVWHLSGSIIEYSAKRSQRLWRLASIAGLAALCFFAMFEETVSAQSAGAPKLAPLINERAPDRIQNQYIVVFKRGTSREAVAAAQDKVKELGGVIRHTYTSALIGFSAKIPDSALPALRAIPGIEYIEADQTVHGQFSQPPDPSTAPPTGLDRTSERFLPLNGIYTYSETGAGVHVYVIDSGIRGTHADFQYPDSGPLAEPGMSGSRVVPEINFVADANGVVNPSATDDSCLGHGTHVAGIIGGKTYGIAKKVTLHAVRFINCDDGSFLADELAAIDWVTAHAIHPAVANLSASGNPSLAADQAVVAAIDAGITFVVAAGNNNKNACYLSPGRVAVPAGVVVQMPVSVPGGPPGSYLFPNILRSPAAITVGATWSENDTRWTYYPPPGTDYQELGSNFGPCVTLFAPGIDIVSAYPDNVPAGGCKEISGSMGALNAKCFGTSMAAPHVAGVAALYLQSHPQATPLQVKRAIIRASNAKISAHWLGVVNRGPGSPNRLLHWGALNDGLDDGNPQ